MGNGVKPNLITQGTLAVYFSTLLFCTPLLANNQIIKQINVLEESFKNLSSTFYQTSIQHTSLPLQTINDMDQLQTEVYRLVNKQQATTAIQLLFLNTNTIQANLEHNAIFAFTELLLEENEWHFANRLFRRIKDEGDVSLTAAMQFIFARYHAERLEWSQVATLLNGIASQLPVEDAAYAYLLNGSALQHLKKHRLAVESYKKIPAFSEYYAYAQLNIAIAHIRQGWWTDAQTTIKQLLKDAQTTENDELTNRLYLVLGYTLLHKEYYRDARDAFRHVGLNSRYTNRALLGIGLTATNQGDFVGGLNALSILKNKKTFDLSIDESYLLIPYVYEKLQQELTVTASYTEAMAYYQERIDNLKNISNQSVDFLNAQYNEQTGSINIANNSLGYAEQYPASFINNYRRLINYLSVTNELKLKSKINALIIKYDSVFQDIVGDLLKQRADYLKSYLNQSRYGLARLYDKSNKVID